MRFDTYFEDDDNVYIVLDLCENQSLMELLRRRKRLTEEETKYYILQILGAIKYLHCNLVIHRDLKLSNVFIAKGMDVKIGDFGLAAKLNSPTQKRTTICGTPNYLAPEILDGKKTGHSFEVDVWSVGVIMYTMLIGRPPFETNDVKATYKRIRANSYAFPSTVHVSEHAKSLIRWILHSNPASRPSINDLVNHPFFTHPKSFIPTSLPESALRSVPTFRPEQLARGSRVVAAFLAERPEQHTIGSVTSSRSKERRTAPPYALKSNTAHTGSDGAGGAKSGGRKPFAPVSQNKAGSHRTAKGKAKTYGSAGAGAAKARTACGGANVGTKPAVAAATASKPEPAREPTSHASPTAPVLKTEQATTPPAPRPAPASRDAGAAASTAPVAQPPRPVAVREGWAAAATASAPPVGAVLGRHASGSATGVAGAASTAAAPVPSRSPAATTAAAATAPREPFYASHALLAATAQATTAAATTDRSPVGGAPATGAATKWASSRAAPAATTAAATAGVTAPPPARHRTSRRRDAPAEPSPAQATVRDHHASPKPLASPAHVAPTAAAAVVANTASGTSGAATKPPVDASKPRRHHRPVSNTDTLKDIHDHLSQSFAAHADGGKARAHAEDPPAAVEAGDLEQPSSWVCTWVDYTSKYGLGYLLADGAVGVYFNDSTKIVLASDNEHFEYIERSSSSSGRRRDIIRQPHTLSSYPESLNKKVTLLKHFRGYLMEQYRKNPIKPDVEVAAMEAGSASSNMTFVKKWVRTRHAVLFRLSNRQVQVNFFDHTSLLLSSRARLVTYVDKQHNRTTQRLADIMAAERTDISKRLQYTKDILQQLITGARR